MQHRNDEAHDSTVAPVAVRHEGHKTLIKWHRARCRAGDPAFTASRIVEGMRAGASVEIDLRIHADRGFAVLHDRDVADATTGTGRVDDLSAAQVRSLFLRAEDGSPLRERVLLLEDLADLLGTIPVHPDALLQLDFKETAAALDDTATRNFADAVTPFAAHAILSCGDAEAVGMLTDAVPGIRIGYDPCHRGAVRRVLLTRAFDGFVERAVSASPRAEMVYLEIRLILEADRRGYDIVGAFHDRGRTVDAYTIRGVTGEQLRQVRRLIELRVDQITTDDPEGLIAAL
ncbi:glycerophosphodiester phosphodiesterase [Gordonia rhizosphera]|uniref:Putative phosphodiesterase n=1 Tax=Gordonia rhizosphera NBRC 16068 TaxID=1108045 RepID=K6W7M0_9ACTN|nr:glycerophosphodiester phosphodiesterase family protein [Gordonia rhizosphera]GAB89716.1 putative phosphodiesterase [Gordonia rhizosphera NBRC 16068]